MGTSSVFRLFWSAIPRIRRSLSELGRPLRSPGPEGPPMEGFTSHVGPATESLTLRSEFWPLSRAVIQQPQVVRPLHAPLPSPSLLVELALLPSP